MEKRQKLSEISYFEVILCFFVVMIHILAESIAHYEKGTIASIAVFSASRMLTFAVPGFVISAGIKFAHKYRYDQFKYFHFINGRIKKIYIPYLFCSVIYYLYFVYQRQYFAFSVSDMAEYLACGSIAAPFYFVVFMMQIYFLAPLIIVYYRKLSPLAGIGIAAVITVFALYLFSGYEHSNKLFFQYFLYWIIGCYIGIDFEKRIQSLKKRRIILFIFAFLIMATYIVLSYMQFTQIYNSFICDIVKVFYCVFVPIAYLSFMPQKQNKVITLIAPVTFYIYLIHCLVLTEMQYILDKNMITYIPLRFVLLSISTYLISIIVSVVYYKTKNRVLKRFFKSE